MPDAFGDPNYGDPILDRADPADEFAPATRVQFGATDAGDAPHFAYITALPIPYSPQERPAWWKRLLLLTVFRRWKCCYRWCSWPATERGFVCDRHGADPSQSGRTGQPS